MAALAILEKILGLKQVEVNLFFFNLAFFVVFLFFLHLNGAFIKIEYILNIWFYTLDCGKPKLKTQYS